MASAGNRAVLYRRVSTEKQAEKFSLPAQRRLLLEIAESRGLTVVEDYLDSGISAETMTARPAFLRMLADAKERKFDRLLVVDLDRISRSQDLRTWAEVLEVLREAGVRIVTPGHELDPGKAEDVFLANIFGAVAALEKSKIMIRARRGVEQAARSGKYATGGAPPFGYDLEPKTRRLLLNPVEGPVIRRIFDEYLMGRSYRWIASAFKDEGLVLRSGRPWLAGDVGIVLRNPIYTGFMVWGRTTTRGGKPWKQVPEDEWIWSEERSHEAIIDLATWQRSRDLRRRRTMSKVPVNYADSTFFLSGLMTCWCGEKMRGTSKRNRLANGEEKLYRYYRCFIHMMGRERHKVVPADVAEEEVVRVVSELGSSPRFLAQARKQILFDRMKADTSASRDLHDLRQELEEIRRKQEVLYDDRLSGRLGEDQWMRFNQRLLDREQELDEQIRRGESVLVDGNGGIADTRSLLQILGDFRAVFEELEPGAQKQVLRAIVAQVRVKEDPRAPVTIRLLHPWSTLLSAEHAEPAKTCNRSGKLAAS